MTEAFTSNPVWIAGIVAVSSAVAPLLIAIVTSSQKRKDRAQEYARLDAVAVKADAVADKAAEAAKLLLESNARVQQRGEVVNEKLDEIHVLVNSNMTAMMQSELDATRTSLALMKEVIDLKRASGKKPSSEAAANLKATEAKVKELSSKLAVRQKPHEK